MPRKKHRRNRNTFSNVRTAAVIEMESHAIVDSDEDTASLSSSVCDDYYTNLVKAGFGMVDLDNAETLDLGKGLPSPPMSPARGNVNTVMVYETAAGNREAEGQMQIVRKGEVELTEAPNGEAINEQEASNDDLDDKQSGTQTEDAASVDSELMEEGLHMDIPECNAADKSDMEVERPDEQHTVEHQTEPSPATCVEKGCDAVLSPPATLSHVVSPQDPKLVFPSSSGSFTSSAAESSTANEQRAITPKAKLCSVVPADRDCDVTLSPRATAPRGKSSLTPSCASSSSSEPSDSSAMAPATAVGQEMAKYATRPSLDIPARKRCDVTPSPPASVPHVESLRKSSRTPSSGSGLSKSTTVEPSTANKQRKINRLMKKSLVMPGKNRGDVTLSPMVKVPHAKSSLNPSRASSSDSFKSNSVEPSVATGKRTAKHATKPSSAGPVEKRYDVTFSPDATLSRVKSSSSPNAALLSDSESSDSGIVEPSSTASDPRQGDFFSSTTLMSRSTFSSYSPTATVQSIPSASSPSVTESLPRRVQTFASDFDRKVWDLVEQQTIAAYRHFCANPLRGETFECEPMYAPKARLAMHRAGEVLGCRSRSTGEGKHRRVVMRWTKNGSFPIGEAAVVAAVRGVLTELFPPKSMGYMPSRTQCKKARREEKRERRRERRLQDEARVADVDVDLDIVEELVAEQDWYTLEQLYGRAWVPALERKRQKSKQRARALSTDAHQLEGVNAPYIDQLASAGGHTGYADGYRQAYAVPQAGGYVAPNFPGYVAYPGPLYAAYQAPVYPVYGQQYQWGGRVDLHRGACSSRRERGTGMHAALNARPLERTNKGFSMLENMGWKEGDGLGVEREGRREPVRAEVRRERAGLGK